MKDALRFVAFWIGWVIIVAADIYAVRAAIISPKLAVVWETLYIMAAVTATTAFITPFGKRRD